MLILDKKELKSSNTHVTIGVFKKGKLNEEYKTTFVGPNNLDKK